MPITKTEALTKYTRTLSQYRKEIKALTKLEKKQQLAKLEMLNFSAKLKAYIPEDMQRFLMLKQRTLPVGPYFLYVIRDTIHTIHTAGISSTLLIMAAPTHTSNLETLPSSAPKNWTALGEPYGSRQVPSASVQKEILSMLTEANTTETI